MVPKLTTTIGVFCELEKELLVETIVCLEYLSYMIKPAIKTKTTTAIRKYTFLKINSPNC